MSMQFALLKKTNYYINVELNLCSIKLNNNSNKIKENL